jgi:hypothetical protein
MKRTCQCNACAVKSCPEETYKNMKYSCLMFRPLDLMKTPLLKHLLMDDRKSKSTIELLKRANIRLEETSYYPNFRLILK